MEKQCIYCGEKLHPEASFCHHCEHSQIEKTPLRLQTYRSKKTRSILFLLLIVLSMTLLWAWKPIQEAPSAEPLEVEEKLIFENGPGMAEVLYNAEDGESYHIYASFSDDREVVAYRKRAIAEDQGRDGSIPSMLFIRNENSDEFMEDDFFHRLVQDISVEVLPQNGAKPLEISKPEQDKLEFPTALRMIHVYMWSYNVGENMIRWTINMKNGDIITLEQTLCIELLEILEYHWEEVPMNTLKSLVDFMEYLERSTEEDQVIDIYLPPVVYEGGLELNRAFRLHGSMDENGTMTTFTAASTAQRSGPSRIQLDNIAFIGNGGVGMTCNETIFLENCHFEGWDIALHVKDDGWSQSDFCTYSNNGIGLLFDCSEGGSFGPDFDENRFENNEIGIQIKAVNRPRTLCFKYCVFEGNDIDIDNLIEHDIETKECIFK